MTKDEKEILYNYYMEKDRLCYYCTMNEPMSICHDKCYEDYDEWFEKYANLQRMYIHFEIETM